VLIYLGIRDSFYAAVFEASKSMPKVQHFGHLKYIVMGEALAQGEENFLTDSLYRSEEIRLNTPLLITKGRASEIVSAKTKEGPIPANIVDDLSQP
jgi:spore germination protein KC